MKVIIIPIYVTYLDSCDIEFVKMRKFIIVDSSVTRTFSFNI